MEEGGGRDRPPSSRQPTEQQLYGTAPLLHYQSDYAQDQQARQTYPSYGSSSVYSIPQSSHTQPYGSVQTYPPRQNTAIEVLSSQFAGAPQYYVPGESSAMGASVHQQGSHFANPSYTQYTPAGPSRVQQQAYAPTPMPEMGRAESSEAVEGQEYAQQQHAAAQLDEAYQQYQTALKRTFQNMRDGRLGEAGSSLLAISDWLLSNAVELGLVRDEQELYGDRTRLWNEFNTCWLSVLQKNKEMIQEYISTGHLPQAPREIIREDFLERMGRDLVRLCDNMERHGLVDYQMGVWEEEIIEAIQGCLELLENGGNAPGTNAGGGVASNPATSQPPL